MNNDYVDYIASQLDKNINYTEYLANVMNPINQKLVDRKKKLKRIRKIIDNDL